jgi:NADPH:quinone reductase-like Zn-dependent oxidoreductase
MHPLGIPGVQKESMIYKSVIVTQRGGPEVLQVIENNLREPSVLAAPVCLPDVTARYGQTPFCPRVPFTPAYAVIGTIDATGKDVRNAAVGDRVAALTAFSGYTEYIYWDAERIIPVTDSLDPVKAVPLILNYIVAYQIMHHSAKVKGGDTVLIIGASGGIGTALLQPGKLAGLKKQALHPDRVRSHTN